MKKIISLLSVVLIFLTSHAQVSGNTNNMSDSSRRHYMHREWNRNGNDSLRKNFGQFRGQAMNNNRFRSRNRMNRFRSFGRSRNSFANRMHIHYSPEQKKTNAFN